MAKLEIAVIGGTRGMGKWFAGFLQKQGFTVHALGRGGQTTCQRLIERCQVVVVSVPIGVTCEVIERVGPLVSTGSLMMDLTSLKAEPVECMLRCSVSEVIGVHPLFGPDVESMKGRNVVICPARGGNWIAWLRQLLTGSGAEVVETTPDRHDRIMAMVQGLTHLTTVAMGLTVRASGVDLSELRRFFTPTFEKKMAMIEKVFGDNQRLYAEIIALNPDTQRLLCLYEEALHGLKGLLARRDSEALLRLMQRAAPLPPCLEDRMIVG
ncbi:MAG: prephenate dehydrogenase/arogenate dehydrogenase family protein [Thermodesulfobacteriota bacterium]